MKKKFLALGMTFIFCFSLSLVFADSINAILFENLHQGAKDVITKIQSGSTDWPFKKNDGSRFGNREKRLPHNGKSFYKEYTVCSAQMNKHIKKGKRPNRGAERIIYDFKNDIYYYTSDHYKTFRRVVIKK